MQHIDTPKESSSVQGSVCEKDEGSGFGSWNSDLVFSDLQSFS